METFRKNILPPSGLVLWAVTSCDLVDPRFSLFLLVFQALVLRLSLSIHVLPPVFTYSSALKIKGGRTPTASRHETKDAVFFSFVIHQRHDSDRCVAVFIISFVSTVLLSVRHVADTVS
jgi:hypothetical protein